MIAAVIRYGHLSLSTYEWGGHANEDRLSVLTTQAQNASMAMCIKATSRWAECAALALVARSCNGGEGEGSWKARGRVVGKDNGKSARKSKHSQVP